LLDFSNAFDKSDTINDSYKTRISEMNVLIPNPIGYIPERVAQLDHVS